MPTIVVDDAEAEMISRSPVVEVRDSSGRLLGVVTRDVLADVEIVRNLSSSDISTVRQMTSAKTLQELFAIANSAQNEDEEYDLLRALDENRVLSGDDRHLLKEGE